MEDVFKTLDLSDDNENFRGYTTMIEPYNALTILLFSQKISRFKLGVAFLKSVSILFQEKDWLTVCQLLKAMLTYMLYTPVKSWHAPFHIISCLIKNNKMPPI